MQLFLVKMTFIDKAHIIGGWARRIQTRMQVLELGLQMDLQHFRG